MIAPLFRQWNHLVDVVGKFTNGLEGQIGIIKSIKAQVQRAKPLLKNIISLGDFKIDMPEDVNQILGKMSPIQHVLSLLPRWYLDLN